MRLILLAFIFFTIPVRAQWLPIIWEYGQLTPDRAEEPVALTLPAEFDSYPCTVQLDTGMSGAFQWHGNRSDESTRITVKVAGVLAEYFVDQKHLEKIHKGDCNAIASVGNAFFENGSLFLDLRNSRYKFERAAVLASSQNAQPLVYARWYDVGGELLVEVKMPSGEIKYAMLDTGATSFGLSALSIDAWTNLVGQPPATTPGVAEYSVNSWGKQIKCFDKEMAGPLSIGLQRKLKTIRVSYCQHPDFIPKQEIAGLLGLRHLMDSVITLDYRSQRWIVEDSNSTIH